MSMPPNDNHDDMYRELYETTEELTEAARALNIAYDRLQDLRDSLNSIAAHNRQAVTRRRWLMRAGPEETATTTTTTVADTNSTMGPNHVALVFSDDDMDPIMEMPRLVNDDLRPRLIEISQHLRRQEMLRMSLRHSGGPSAVEPSEADFPRPVFAPTVRRRRAPQLPMSSSNVVSPPSSNSAARRSTLQAHLRQLQRASDPSDPSTTLGRRVTQRAAASATAAATAGSSSPSNAVVHSTFPLGIELRPSPSTLPIESRAAAHLRHSFLPNPSTTRPSGRFEPRQRTMRSNSLTALTRPSTSTDLPSVQTQTNIQAPPQSLQSTNDLPSRQGTHYVDTVHRSYRVRRLVNSSGEDDVMNINWRDMMSDHELDPPTWLYTPSPVHRTVQPNMFGPQPEADENAISNDASPGISATSRDVRSTGQPTRRRGWARLNADGDEVSSEDEASLERSGAYELRPAPRPRNWDFSPTTWVDPSAAVLDLVQQNQNQHQSSIDTQNAKRATTTQVLDMLFTPEHGVDVGYVNPLPGRLAKKNRKVDGEVWVRMEADIVGR